MMTGYGLKYPSGLSLSNFETGQEDTRLFDLEKMMNLFGKSGGLFGLGAAPTAGLIGFGTELFKGLAGLLGGKSDEEKRREEVYNLAKNRLGQSPIDPTQYLPLAQQAMAPQISKLGELINKRGMLDTGVGQSELATAQIQGLSEFLLNLRQRADELKAMQQNAMLQLMAGVSGG